MTVKKFHYAFVQYLLKEQIKVFADDFLLAFRQIHSVQDLWQLYC